MTKYKCMVCQPSCLLELRGYKLSDGLPTGCTFPENGYSPAWQAIGAKTAAKKGAKKSAKKTVSHTTTVSHENNLKRLLGF